MYRRACCPIETKMTWNLYPTLEEPDYCAWEQYFPSGVGGSAFSSPRFQRLILCEYGPGWQQRMLRVTGKSQCLSLPVLVRRIRHRRYHLVAPPTSYYVVPIEQDSVTSETVIDVLDAVDRIGTARFTWWLPPWTSLRPADFDTNRYGDRLQLSSFDTFVISCETNYEEHWTQRVRKVRRYEARTSLARGLEVLESPPPEVVDEYYELYRRVHSAQCWVGPQFHRRFFQDAAINLGDGGKLFVMRLKDRVVGGGVLLFDRHAVHYYQGARDSAIKGVFPHSVLYSEALKRAYKLGLRYVNLGPVNEGNDQLANFKRSWGAVPMTVPVVHWSCSRAQAARMALQKLRNWLG